MGKEIKIGLIVIAVLLCLFGGALYLRLRHESPTVAKDEKSSKHEAGRAKSREKKSTNETEPSEDDPEQSRRPRDSKRKSLFGKLPDQDADGRSDGRADERESANPFGGATDDGGTASGRLRNAWSSAETDDANDTSADDQSSSDRQFAADGEASGDDHAAAGQRSTTGDRYATYASRQNGIASDDDAVDDDGQGALIGAADGADLAERATSESLANGYRVTGDRDAADAAAADDDAVEMPDDRFQLSSADGPGEVGDDGADGESQAAPSSRDADSALSGDSADRTGEELADDSTSERDARAADERFSARDGLAAPAPFERIDSHVRPLAGDVSDSREAAGDLADEEAPALAATDDARPLEDGEGERSYTVEANDNFWRISQKLYGTGAYFKALREYNRQRYAGGEVMNVGDELAVPSLETLRRDYPALCPKQRRAAGRPATSLVNSTARPRRGREYTVAEGDTLFDIARHELGKASRWLEVYELNREQLGDDFNYLAPGMRLALPADGPAPDPVTTRDDRDRYQR